MHPLLFSLSLSLSILNKQTHTHILSLFLSLSIYIYIYIFFFFGFIPRPRVEYTAFLDQRKLSSSFWELAETIEAEQNWGTKETRGDQKRSRSWTKLEKRVSLVRERNVDSVNEGLKKKTTRSGGGGKEEDGGKDNDLKWLRKGGVLDARRVSREADEARSKLESPARCLNEKKVASSSDGRGIETKKVSTSVFLFSFLSSNSIPSKTSDVRRYFLSLSAPWISLDFVHPFRHPKHHVSPLEKSSFENFANCHLLLFLEKKKRFKKSGAYSRSGLIAPRATEHPPLSSLFSLIVLPIRWNRVCQSFFEKSAWSSIYRWIDARTGSSVGSEKARSIYPNRRGFTILISKQLVSKRFLFFSPKSTRKTTFCFLLSFFSPSFFSFFFSFFHFFAWFWGGI